MRPANRRLDVLIGSRRGSGTDQAVVDRHGEEAPTGPLGDLESGVVDSLASAPPTSVHVHDDRQILAVDRVGDVSKDCRPERATVDDVRLDGYRYLRRRNSR